MSSVNWPGGPGGIQGPGGSGEPARPGGDVPAAPASPSTTSELAASIGSWLAGQPPADLMQLRERIQGERQEVAFAQGLVGTALGRPPAASEVRNSIGGLGSLFAPAAGLDTDDERANPVRALVDRMALERSDIVGQTAARLQLSGPMAPTPATSLAELYGRQDTGAAETLRGAIDERLLQAHADLLAELESSLDHAIAGTTDTTAPDRPVLLHAIRVEALTPMRAAAEFHLAQCRRNDDGLPDLSGATRPDVLTVDALRPLCSQALAPIVAAERDALLAVRHAAFAHGDHAAEAQRQAQAGPDGEAALNATLQAMTDTAWLAQQVLERYTDPAQGAGGMPVRIRSVAGGERIPFPVGFFSQGALYREVCVADRALTDDLHQALSQARQADPPLDPTALADVEQAVRHLQAAQGHLAAVRSTFWPQAPSLDQPGTPLSPDLADAAAQAREPDSYQWTGAVGQLDSADDAIQAAKMLLRDLEGRIRPDGPAGSRALLEATQYARMRLPMDAHMFRPVVQDAFTPAVEDVAARVGRYGAFAVAATGAGGMGAALTALDRILGETAGRDLFLTDRPHWMQQA
jgi:hypothetical protein